MQPCRGSYQSVQRQVINVVGRRWCVLTPPGVAWLWLLGQPCKQVGHMTCCSALPFARDVCCAFASRVGVRFEQHQYSLGNGAMELCSHSRALESVPARAFFPREEFHFTLGNCVADDFVIPNKVCGRFLLYQKSVRGARPVSIRKTAVRG